MIAKEFETFLLGQEETFLTPAKNLAVLIDTHNADHATLLLSQMTYTRVPVVTDEKQFVGTIGLRDIMAFYPLGTKVTLIGSNGDKEITATQVATYRVTINYEVVCLLSDRIPREYY
ncbi:hypothetical protein K8353_39980 [Burkholderia contaminans]|nr:hypothetical protein [Burkholderia contaminans]